MAELDFPDSPTIGQSFNAGERRWVWDGTTWNQTVGVLNEVIGPTGPTGPETVIISATAPTDTSVIWADTTETGTPGPTGPTGPTGPAGADADIGLIIALGG